MVTLQPNLEQIAELPIVSDVAGGQVAMVIKDRLFFRKVMIEPFGSAGLQQKIFVNEFHRLVISDW